MKIYNSIEMQWDDKTESFITIEEDSYEHSGPIAELKGGGGASGEVKYPQYQMDWHGGLLGSVPSSPNDYKNKYVSSLNANPYSTAQAYNPQSDLTGLDTVTTLLQNAWQNVNPVADWSSYTTQAANTFDGTIHNASYIDDEVDVYEDKTEEQYAKSSVQFSAGMADINAVMSSAFVQGLANLEITRQKDISNFKKQMKTKYYEGRLNFIATASQMMMTILQQQLQLGSAVVGTVMEAKKTRITAQTDYEASSVDLNVKDANWELDVLQKTAGGMAALSGGQFVPNEPSKNPIAGALSGAASGFAMGGPIGAGIGGLLGLFG